MHDDYVGDPARQDDDNGFAKEHQDETNTCYHGETSCITNDEPECEPTGGTEVVGSDGDLNESVLCNVFHAAVKTPNETAQTADQTFGAGVLSEEFGILPSQVFKSHFEHLDHCYHESTECNRSQMVSKEPSETSAKGSFGFVI